MATALFNLIEPNRPVLTRREHATQRSPEEQLQDTFSEVLARAGRQGYRSAEPVSAEAHLENKMISSWEDWFDSVASRRYTFVADAGNPSVQKGSTAASLKCDFGEILSDARAQGGYVSPNAYLKSLSPEQLAVLQQVQHLAERIDPMNLSEESALNLLLPPASQVDSDGDGITAVGAGLTLRFPDSNTPTSVRRAWEIATKNLSEGDRMTYELQMRISSTGANLHSDASQVNRPFGRPGAADGVHSTSNDERSYVDAANRWLEYLELFRSRMSADRNQRDQTFWTTFRDALSEPKTTLVD